MRDRSADEMRWRLTLVAGGVTVVVVAGLLEALRRSVDEVAAAVDRAWTAGKLVAQNTQSAHLLDETQKGTHALRQERHEAAEAWEGTA